MSDEANWTVGPNGEARWECARCHAHVLGAPPAQWVTVAVKGNGIDMHRMFCEPCGLAVANEVDVPLVTSAPSM